MSCKKNLPNKKSIGKQDPYCTLQLGTHSQKTKPDKRGGQHPTWDEQLHFEIYDDMEDQLRNTDDAAGSIGSSSSSSSPRKRPTKTSKTLRVACYADDTKEPEFIGDGVVDLTDTLKSGEFDEWVTIKAKDRYAGEVYLELTFYSAVREIFSRKRRVSADSDLLPTTRLLHQRERSALSQLFPAVRRMGERGRSQKTSMTMNLHLDRLSEILATLLSPRICDQRRSNLCMGWDTGPVLRLVCTPPSHTLKWGDYQQPMTFHIHSGRVLPWPSSIHTLLPMLPRKYTGRRVQLL